MGEDAACQNSQRSQCENDNAERFGASSRTALCNQIHVTDQFRSGLIDIGQYCRCDQAFNQADRQMDGLHERAERAERKRCNTGKRSLQHDREGAHLQCHDASDEGRRNDPGSLRLAGFHLAKQAALHNRPPDQVIADKAPIEGHVPYVGAERHQPAVGKKQTLDR